MIVKGWDIEKIRTIMVYGSWGCREDINVNIIDIWGRERGGIIYAFFFIYFSFLWVLFVS